MTEWIDIIGRLGFPIAAFAICAWFLKYVYDKSLSQYENAINKIGDLTSAVNHNSEVLADLVREVSKK